MSLFKTSKHVLDWLDERTIRSPNRMVYADLEREMTFYELSHHAQAVASEIIRFVRPGMPIVVLCGRHVWTPVAYFAALYAGCYYVPIDTGLPVARMRQIIQMVVPALILADRDHSTVAVDLANKSEILVVETCAEGPVDQQKLADIRSGIISTDPMYVLFTSGSTGTPKGVVTSHQALMCYIEAFAKALTISGNDVFGCQAALDYVAAIRDLYAPVFTGAQMHIVPKEYFSMSANLFEFLNKRRITTLAWSVTALVLPAQLGVFARQQLQYVKKIIFTGSIMPNRFLRIWQENLPHAIFVNQYGPTEATASCTYYVINHLVEENEVLPIGTPYKNYKVLLLTEDGTPTPVGEIGEIYVGGPALALGYFRDPERTQEAFVMNPTLSDYPERLYRTGDLGSLRKDANLLFHGRKDQQIKHLGHRVELSEIEAVGQNIEGIGECHVLYDIKKELIWFFYAGTPLSATVLAKEFRSILPSYMVPRKFQHVDVFARLPNGKIDRRALEAKMM